MVHKGGRESRQWEAERKGEMKEETEGQRQGDEEKENENGRKGWARRWSLRWWNCFKEQHICVCLGENSMRRRSRFPSNQESTFLDFSINTMCQLPQLGKWLHFLTNRSPWGSIKVWLWCRSWWRSRGRHVNSLFDLGSLETCEWKEAPAWSRLRHLAGLNRYLCNKLSLQKIKYILYAIRIRGFISS